MAYGVSVSDMKVGVGYIISLNGYRSEDGADMAIISMTKNTIYVRWVVFKSIVHQKINDSLRQGIPHYMIYIDNRNYVHDIRKATLSLDDLQGVYGVSDLEMEEVEALSLSHLYMCIVMWAEINTYSERAGV